MHAPIRLRPVGSDVGRMVFVPGGNQGGVELTDYWIDQTEVTNREFKDFIDRGGYQDPQLWTYLRQEHPNCSAARAPVRRFGIEPDDLDHRRGSWAAILKARATIPSAG